MNMHTNNFRRPTGAKSLSLGGLAQLVYDDNIDENETGKVAEILAEKIKQNPRLADEAILMAAKDLLRSVRITDNKVIRTNASEVKWTPPSKAFASRIQSGAQAREQAVVTQLLNERYSINGVSIALRDMTRDQVIIVADEKRGRIRSEFRSLKFLEAVSVEMNADKTVGESLSEDDALRLKEQANQIEL